MYWLVVAYVRNKGSLGLWLPFFSFLPFVFVALILCSVVLCLAGFGNLPGDMVC